MVFVDLHAEIRAGKQRLGPAQMRDHTCGLARPKDTVMSPKPSPRFQDRRQGLECPPDRFWSRRLGGSGYQTLREEPTILSENGSLDRSAADIVSGVRWLLRPTIPVQASE